jgi:undecaprenyl diphosphate synthase
MNTRPWTALAPLLLLAVLIAGCGGKGPAVPEYEPAGTWGTTGEGPGAFHNPIGITYAGGELYVSDAGNNRIQVFDTTGTFRRQFDGSGSVAGRLLRPMHLEARAREERPGLQVAVPEYGADRITVSVSVLDEAVVPTLRRELAELSAPRPLAVRTPDDTEQADEPIQISIGLGGKREFTETVRQLAEAVDDGDLTPEEIEAEHIADRLVFREEPDLVIKTGAERLSDFMIWQSVYSELYFTDVNWRDFRKRDYLRALLDYEDRQRRFGE